MSEKLDHTRSSVRDLDLLGVGTGSLVSKSIISVSGFSRSSVCQAD